jgi:hypothetical protein
MGLIENNSMENQVENHVDVFCFLVCFLSLRLSYIQIFFVIGDDRMVRCDEYIHADGVDGVERIRGLYLWIESIEINGM